MLSCHHHCYTQTGVLGVGLVKLVYRHSLHVMQQFSSLYYILAYASAVSSISNLTTLAIHTEKHKDVTFNIYYEK